MLPPCTWSYYEALSASRVVFVGCSGLSYKKELPRWQAQARFEDEVSFQNKADSSAFASAGQDSASLHQEGNENLQNGQGLRSLLWESSLLLWGFVLLQNIGECCVCKQDEEDVCRGDEEEAGAEMPRCKLPSRHSFLCIVLPERVLRNPSHALQVRDEESLSGVTDKPVCH